MSPSDQTKAHVIARYVQPARKRGQNRVRVRIGDVLKELGWTNRTPSVFSTLSSKAFQIDAGVELVEKVGGPASGGPSTTWQFVYRILPESKKNPSRTKTQNGSGLDSLYGICADTFKALGGGEAFLKREREWGQDAWERYESELARRTESEPGR